MSKVIIDKDVDIGPYTRIWTTGHNPDSASHEVYSGDVLISDHVWIASGVTILPGVHLGRGAVVGASSVVHKNIPPMEIWAGVPAGFKRKRDNSLEYKLYYKAYFE